MIPSLPLENKQVLIPRGAKQARSFAQLVKQFGGIPVVIPLLAFRPVPESEEISAILNQLHTYDWIIFTSDVTVETFFLLYGAKLSRFPKVAVIGEKTRQAVEQKQIKVSFVPKRYVAECFSEEFSGQVTPGTRVLLPKGNLARSYIASSLTAQGAVVDEIIIYETYFPEESRTKLIQVLREGKLDILPFTSPSTVDHFMETVKEGHFEQTIEKCIIACIGPIAKKRAIEYGLTVHVCPEVYTVEHMIHRVIDYLTSSSKSPTSKSGGMQ